MSRLMQTDAKPKYLKDVTLSFVMAGKDTTATTLSWFVYMLCKNHLVQQKVAEEIKEATQSDGAPDSISDFAAGLSDEALEKMQYLHSTLTETLRLYPPVPVVRNSFQSHPNKYSELYYNLVSFCQRLGSKNMHLR